MSWTRTSSARLPVTAAAVWRILSDPVRWPEWEPTTARLHERSTPPFAPRGPTPSGAWRSPGRPAPDRCGSSEPSGRRTRAPSSPRPWRRRGATPVIPARVAAELDRGLTDAAVRLARLAGSRADPALPRVVIAGGSGSLGRLLGARLFARGHDVRIITHRRDPRLPFDQVIWDGRTVGDWADALRSADEAGWR